MSSLGDSIPAEDLVQAMHEQKLMGGAHEVERFLLNFLDQIC